MQKLLYFRLIYSAYKYGQNNTKKWNKTDFNICWPIFKYVSTNHQSSHPPLFCGTLWLTGLSCPDLQVGGAGGVTRKAFPIRIGRGGKGGRSLVSTHPPTEGHAKVCNPRIGWVCCHARRLEALFNLVHLSLLSPDKLHLLNLLPLYKSNLIEIL